MVEHRLAQDAHGVQDYIRPSVEQFGVIWTKELAGAEVPIRAEAEVANRAVDAVPIDPNVRVANGARSRSRYAAMEVNTRSTC